MAGAPARARAGIRVVVVPQSQADPRSRSWTGAGGPPGVARRTDSSLIPSLKFSETGPERVGRHGKANRRSTSSMALFGTRPDPLRTLRSHSKTVVSQGTVGSNPTPSARRFGPRSAPPRPGRGPSLRDQPFGTRSCASGGRVCIRRDRSLPTAPWRRHPAGWTRGARAETSLVRPFATTMGTPAGRRSWTRRCVRSATSARRAAKRRSAAPRVRPPRRQPSMPCR